MTSGLMGAGNRDGVSLPLSILMFLCKSNSSWCAEGKFPGPAGHWALPCHPPQTPIPGMACAQPRSEGGLSLPGPAMPRVCGPHLAFCTIRAGRAICRFWRLGQTPPPALPISGREGLVLTPQESLGLCPPGNAQALSLAYPSLPLHIATYGPCECHDTCVIMKWTALTHCHFSDCSNAA